MNHVVPGVMLMALAGAVQGTAIAVLSMIALALTWLSVALGLVTKSVESASNLLVPLVVMFPSALSQD